MSDPTYDVRVRQTNAVHSAGPWHVVGDELYPANARITATSRRHIAKVYARSLDRDDVCDANAALIAAAPELFEALRQLVGALPTRRDWLDPMVEAMAKDALQRVRPLP